MPKVYINECNDLGYDIDFDPSVECDEDEDVEFDGDNGLLQVPKKKFEKWKAAYAIFEHIQDEINEYLDSYEERQSKARVKASAKEDEDLYDPVTGRLLKSQEQVGEHAAVQRYTEV